MMPDDTVTRSTEPHRHQSEHPDPITLLRQHQRQALDRQATLSIQARALATEVAQVTAELTEVTANVNLYRALLAAVARAATKDET